jgi:hypothetical protein
MKTLKITLILFMIPALATINSNSLSAQAKKQTNVGTGASTLVYNFPAGRPVHYVSNDKITQLMDIEGQQMQVYIQSMLGCSVASKGMKDNNLQLEITIDSLSQSINSPQGTSGGDIPDASGKTFTIVLAPSGEELSSGAEQVKLNLPGSGQTSMVQFFNKFFPVMPKGNVKPGYAWPSTDTISFKTESSSITQVVRSQNTFAEYEDFMGVQCAKITSVLEGTSLIKNQTSEVDMTMNVSFSGSGTTYFAPSAGYFLQHNTSLKMKGTVDMLVPVSMTFPVVMDVTNLKEVRK